MPEATPTPDPDEMLMHAILHDPVVSAAYKLGAADTDRLTAELEQARADVWEMETQRNAYGEALTRIANGEEPVRVIAGTMKNLAAIGDEDDRG